jgi:hypothetical protein
MLSGSFYVARVFAEYRLINGAKRVLFSRDIFDNAPSFGAGERISRNGDGGALDDAPPDRIVNDIDRLRPGLKEDIVVAEGGKIADNIVGVLKILELTCREAVVATTVSGSQGPKPYRDIAATPMSPTASSASSSYLLELRRGKP